MRDKTPAPSEYFKQVHVKKGLGWTMGESRGKMAGGGIFK